MEENLIAAIELGSSEITGVVINSFNLLIRLPTFTR